MRHINLIVIHCSATPPGMDIGAREIRSWHVEKNGWKDIGYHFVIRRDGRQENGRHPNQVGAGVLGYNKHSLHICYIGGVDEDFEPEDNRTDCQRGQLLVLLRDLKQKFPRARLLGHRDLSPDQNGDGIIQPWEWMKDCPSFDARSEYQNL